MALASATPPTQPGPTLILRAKPFLAGPPNRHRPASPQLWTAPQPHSPRSLSPSYSLLSVSPTSSVLGPTPIQTQTQPLRLQVSPFSLAPTPSSLPGPTCSPVAPPPRVRPRPLAFPAGAPQILGPRSSPLPAAPLAQPRPRPVLQWPRPLAPPPAAPPPAASTFDVFPWEPAGVGDRMPARLRVGGDSWRRGGQRGDREPAAHGARGDGIAQVAAAGLLKRQELPRPPRAAPGPSARCAQPPQSGHFSLRPWAVSFTKST